MKTFLVLLFASLMIGQTAIAQKPEPGKDSTGTQLKLYGFITLDATYDFRNAGKNDVFKPSDIPLAGQSTGPSFFMSAKQTRIGAILTRSTPLGPVKGVFEADFHNTADQANGLLRIRHAFVQWRGLTAGQTWSTFYDIESRPQTVDYQGPAGSSFMRVPLIRYELANKNHIWSIGLEDPVEDIAGKGDIQLIKQTAPDVIAGYKTYWNGRRSFLKLAVLGRQFKYQTTDSISKLTDASNVYGWGAMAVGRLGLNSGEDNIKFELAGGAGVAHYLLGTTGLNLDAIVDAKGQKPDDIHIGGGFVAYQHYWSRQLNSTAIAGAYEIGDRSLFNNSDLHYSVYATANLFYTPVKPLSVGLEYQYAQRKNFDDSKAAGNRIQGAIIYNF